MGFFASLSNVSPARNYRADTSASSYVSDFFSGADMPDTWMASLTAAGVTVTPDLALTLSAVACAVRVISYDIATLPLQTFKLRPDGGKDLIRGRSTDLIIGGIGDLAYMLRWAPNNYQTATEYFVGQLAQWLLRSVAYAEIVPGPSGFVGQLLPRHPDRVFPERLPNGNLRYKLIERNGQPRYLTQDEMHVVRDMSQDGLRSVSRTQYAATALGTGLAAERAAGKFFKSGMTASVLATYSGDQEDDDDTALYNSIARYAAGVENNFGLLLVPDDVKVSNLSVEPDKAQMMLARQWTVEEVSRTYNISPRKLHRRGTGDSYGSAYQDAIDHVVSCLRPVAVTFQQAIQRDLVLDKDTYFTKFDLRELLQGDPAAMGTYIQTLIKSRAMTPSEVRTLLLDLNADDHLDALSEMDNQPGKPASAPAPASARTVSNRAQMKGMLAIHDAAVRCVRRERAAVEKLAKKHASDVDGWKAALRDFYADHAAFVAETMRVSSAVAREYAAQHGSAFEAKGLMLMTGEGAGVNSEDAAKAWERFEADELAALSLEEAA